ncbi:hypothetical protein ACFVAJ_16945 [Agromyces sp. NPDC057679]|uniref:hypothetical protein n=1 Tax=Agromyces sp. NPDC057679 TaxID=3346207 RepID=UPI00366C8D61
MAKPERKTFREAYQENLDQMYAKRERKALKKTPETAEWVVLEVTSEADMRAHSGRGWEIVDYPAKGVYKDWVKRYTMRRRREELAAQLEGPTLTGNTSESS